MSTSPVTVWIRQRAADEYQPVTVWSRQRGASEYQSGNHQRAAWQLPGDIGSGIHEEYWPKLILSTDLRGPQILNEWVHCLMYVYSYMIYSI